MRAFSLPILLASGAALTLAACAASPARLDAPVSGGAPLPVANYDWFFHADGDDGSLAYGIEASDDMKLGLECRKGSRSLIVTSLARPGAPPSDKTEILLESGGETERWPAEVEPSGIHDGDMLTATADSHTPVFQRFRATGWIAQWRGEDRETYVAQPGSDRGVRSFFDFCG